MLLEEIVSNNLIIDQDELLNDQQLLKQIQTKLKALNEYSGQIDGWKGPRSVIAITRFSEDVHLDNVITGKFGPTWAKALLEAKLPQFNTKEQRIRGILAECKKQMVTEVNQLAYVLGTVQHETNNTYAAVEEAYYMGAAAAAYRAKLRYAPFWGRGPVQLTWESNYRLYESLTGKPLVKHPELMLTDFPLSVFVLVDGFKHGRFTGVGINRYIGNGRRDFYNCRRVINGLDQAQHIAGLANQWLRQLSAYSVA